jgi:hypothetical protein
MTFETEYEEKKQATLEWLDYKTLFYIQTLTYFPFDGYNQQTATITYPNNKPLIIRAEDSLTGMLLAGFFGFPSRPEAVPNKSMNPTPKLTVRQFFKNLMGGFDWAKTTDTEKKFWQIVLMPVKIGIILPLKLLTFPLKFSLNMVKLVALILAPLFFTFLDNCATNFFIWSLKLTSGFRLPAMVVAGVLKAVSWAFLSAIGTVAGILSIVLSPAMSARNGFYATKQSLENLIDSETAKNVVAGFNAFLNIAIAVTGWAIILPMLMSAVVTLFPALLTAVAVVAQIPLAAAVLLSIKAPVLAFAAGFNTFWGVTWIAGVGTQASALLAAGVALGFFGTLLAIPASLIADNLSDRWATWHKGGPMTSLYKWLVPESNVAKESDILRAEGSKQEKAPLLDRSEGVELIARLNKKYETEADRSERMAQAADVKASKPSTVRTDTAANSNEEGDHDFDLSMQEQHQKNLGCD